MADSRGETLQRLFLECLEQPAERRAASLEQACPDDPRLRAEVESLIASHEESGDFLEEMDRDRAAALVEAASEADLQGTIGAYRPLRELGRGGMGVVYLAERADGQFEQRVALKLIKRGMDSDEILRRFLLERQILARLQHANIAGLLDGGITDEGQPYFAMEYVEGLPLLEYCDRHRLGIGARLRLFEEIGRAVQYAHQKLVVHRDLKPSNILVTAAGEVKLLDFGIAKLLDPEREGGAPTLTEAGLRLVTPEYGSPEQLRGEPVTTSSDTYALGVILYELLAGRRPFRYEERTPEALARRAGETEAVRPSTAVVRDPGPVGAETIAAARSTTVPRLQRRLRGDLDTIILKALRREPERRFPSVEALLADLERYRAGLPVQARPDTFTYRTAKFLRRHGLGAAALLLVVLSLAGGLAVALWQRQLARTEAEKAEQVQQFLMDIFEVSDPGETKGEEVTARELLDQGAARVQEALADQPEVQARMMTVIGELYVKLGMYDPALAQFEGALQVQRQHFGPGSIEAAGAGVYLSYVLINQAEYDRAEELVRPALEVYRREYGEDHQEVAAVMNALGLILAEKGEYEEAESFLRRAVAVNRRSLGDLDPATLSSLANLGLALRWGGKLEEAEEVHREAADLARRAFGDDHPDTAWALERLGVGLAQRGDTDEAEPLLREGLDIMIRVLGDEHPDTALARNNLARTLLAGGDFAAAEPLFRRALQDNAAAHGEDSLYVTTNLANLAEVLLREGEYDEARSLLQRAVELRRTHLGEEHPDVAKVLQRLAYAEMRLGNLERADALYAEALPRAREGWAPDHPDLATLLCGYGELWSLTGRCDAARPLLREALQIRQRVLVEDRWEIGEAEVLLGECLLERGQPTEAAPLLHEAHRRLDAALGSEDRLTRRATAALARLPSSS